jgi:hypothetical protein
MSNSVKPAIGLAAIECCISYWTEKENKAFSEACFAARERNAMLDLKNKMLQSKHGNDTSTSSQQTSEH